MGSPNKFGWLSTVNVTSLLQVTKICHEIPAALGRLGFACSLRSTRKTSTTPTASRFSPLRMTG